MAFLYYLLVLVVVVVVVVVVFDIEVPFWTVMYHCRHYKIFLWKWP